MCMQLEAHEHCGLRPTVADGWQLLVPDPGGISGRFLAPLLWLGLPGLMAGLMAGGSPLRAGGMAALAAAAAAATAALPGVGFSAAAVAGSVSAVVLGAALARTTHVRASGARSVA